MYLKLAWRNIWRNKKRSLITISSIFLAVILAVFMRAMQLGSYDLIIDSIVHSYTGYIQVHSNGYWDEQTLENSMEVDKEMIEKVMNEKGVTLVVPRLESFALSSYGQLTKGAMIVGIDPELEEDLMRLSEKLTEGEMFTNESKSVLLAQGLADYYKIGVGDTIVLLSQGYHGVSAAGKYPIAGILKFGSPQLNDRFISMPLKEAQWFYGAEDRITSLALLVGENKQMKRTIKNLSGNIDIEKYEVMNWEEMMPELVQTIQADSVGGLIMLFVLYMIITFGIFGTVLMMTSERMYEFGVMISVGMKRWKIAVIIFIETCLISLVGVIIGGIVIEPVIFYFSKNPITLTGQAAQAMIDYGWEPVMPTTTDPSIMITHTLVIVLVSLFIAIYPAIVISRLKPVNAMRI